MSDLKIDTWLDDENQDGARDLTFIDDVAVSHVRMVHVEMLDKKLAYLHIIGERGTDDVIQLDIRVIDGRLRIYEP